MEGEIICRENVKPCSPTPPCNRIYKPSLLDQIFPPITVPLVLYYPNNINNNNPISNNINNIDEYISQTTQNLKQSLSATLSLFYPLAGRVKDSFSTDCNDQGALFIVARFDCNLSAFLGKPDLIRASLSHLPSRLMWVEPTPGSHVAMIQVNYFDCGGIAIGSVFWHKVVDGVAYGAFLKAWAAINARASSEDQTQMFLPNYTAQSLFPQNQSAMRSETHLFSIKNRYLKTGKTTMRRYVFDASAISELRSQLMSTGQRPSRVEAVSALMWKCFMVASSSTPERYCLVTHAVNLRRKAEPLLPENSFGNWLWVAPASTLVNNGCTDLKVLFSKLRRAVSKIDGDFVKRMQGDEGFGGYCKNVEETWNEYPENANYLSINSWCNFGFYGIDFGWGKPAWITRCDMGSDVTESPFLNVLWLMDTRDGDGIEAWLIMDQRYFPEFDKIQELRDLASIDPSPLCIAPK